MAADAYLYHAESGQPGSPLLFLFHGTGGNERQFLGLGRDLLPDASLVAPRGDVSEHGSDRFFRRTAEGVYDMDDLARATQKMAGFVHAHREAAQPTAAIGLGYSNGANILASVLFAQPDLFDAVVLMHPLIPFQPRIAGNFHGKRLLVTAGRRDPICPPNLTVRLESYLREAGADLTLTWHEGGHDVRPSEIEAARVFLAPLRRQGVTGMADEMQAIELEDSGSKGRYFIRSAGGEVAEMTFTKVGARQIIIDHTAVPDAFRGQGVGLQLVARAVEDARAAGKTIIPLCPFAAAQFRRHPEWKDVLKA